MFPEPNFIFICFGATADNSVTMKHLLTTSAVVASLLIPAFGAGKAHTHKSVKPLAAATTTSAKATSASSVVHPGLGKKLTTPTAKTTKLAKKKQTSPSTEPSTKPAKKKKKKNA